MPYEISTITLKVVKAINAFSFVRSSSIDEYESVSFFYPVYGLFIGKKDRKIKNSHKFKWLSEIVKGTLKEVMGQESLGRGELIYFENTF